MIEPLTSLQNPRVKSAVKLRARREREKQGRFLIEGYRELRRAVNAKLPIGELFTCHEHYLGENEDALVADAQEQCGAEVVPVVATVFNKLSYRDRPDGLLGIAPIPQWSLEQLEPKANGIYVVAVTIEKPGNLGTILRTADAVGADGVIICDRCTDVFNPNVVRASVGALFTVPVAETTTDELLPWLAGNGIEIVATTPAAELIYTDANLLDAVALAVGSEQYGLPDRWLEAATHRVVIPMAGEADSLNAAVATAVVLFEATRQRR